MQVLMSMLFDGLSRKYSCEKGTCFDPDAMVMYAAESSRVLSDVRKEGAYIAAGDDEIRDLPAPLQPERLIVVSRDIPLELPCALFIREELDAAQVINEANEVIFAYERWSQRLYELLLEGADYFELVEQAHEMLGNPITVIDQTLRTLAYSKSDVMNDAMWIPDRRADAIDYSEAGEEDIKFFLSELKERRRLHQFTISDGNYISACVACLDGNDMVGICLVHKNRVISEGDFACLCYFSEIIGLAVRMRHSSWTESIGGYDALIRDAIEGRISDEQVLARRAALLGVTLSDNFEVIAVRPRRGFFNDAQIDQVKRQMQAIIFSGYVIGYQRDVVVVVSYEQGKLPIAEDMKRFSRQLAASRLIAGISDRSSQPLDLSKLYQQAHDAVRIGKRVYPDETVVKYEQCRRYYLYESSFRRGDWDSYVHPALYQLQELDRQSNSQLFETLSCLLENGGSKSKTAKALFIQRNTLQYRLDKIEKHCGIDLSDTDTLNHLYTSLELLEYCTVK